MSGSDRKGPVRPVRPGRGDAPRRPASPTPEPVTPAPLPPPPQRGPSRPPGRGRAVPSPAGRPAALPPRDAVGVDPAPTGPTPLTPLAFDPGAAPSTGGEVAPTLWEDVPLARARAGLGWEEPAGRPVDPPRVARLGEAPAAASEPAPAAPPVARRTASLRQWVVLGAAASFFVVSAGVLVAVALSGDAGEEAGARATATSGPVAAAPEPAPPPREAAPPAVDPLEQEAAPPVPDPAPTPRPPREVVASPPVETPRPPAPTAPPARVAAAPPKVEPARVEPAKVEPPKAEPPKAEPRRDPNRAPAPEPARAPAPASRPAPAEEPPPPPPAPAPAAPRAGTLSFTFQAGFLGGRLVAQCPSGTKRLSLKAPRTTLDLGSAACTLNVVCEGGDSVQVSWPADGVIDCAGCTGDDPLLSCR